MRLLSIVLAGGLAACGKATTAPSEGPVFDRIEVTGPGVPESSVYGPTYRVMPGETAQFKAIAWFRDGSSQDITTRTDWESSDSKVLSASRGLVTGRQRGEAFIYVTLEGPPARSVSQHVIVLPPDSYIVTGQVFESRNPPVTLDSARLTVLDGPIAGEQVVSMGSGSYRFFGLSGPTTIRVEKAGYQTQDSSVVVSDHQTFDVDLKLIRPRPELSGTYTLTLTAANECLKDLSEGNLPADARQRRYSAIVTQNGPLLSVELSGAAFVDPMPADRRFTGRIDPFTISFDMMWWDANWDFGPPRIVETLPTGEVLVISGYVDAAASQGSVSGTFYGYFYIYPAGVTPRANLAAAAHCYSPNHRFVLSR